MSVQCPSCSSHRVREKGKIHATHIFTSHNLNALLEGGHLFICMECHLGFRYPVPSQEKLDQLYRSSGTNLWKYNPTQRVDWQIAKEWLGKLFEKGSILDVGCFDGAFLHFLGHSWNRSGVEINEAAIRVAEERGIAILAPDLKQLSNLALSSDSHQFDAIVTFDVIEHVPDPRKLLTDMLALVRPGGIVILATGNLDSFTWRLMGSAYWYCTIPEHIAFISTTWCKHVSHDLGLELLDIQTYSHEQNRTLALSLREWSANMMYKLTPRLFAALRRSGLGKKDTERFDELAYHPPTWTTARDHLIAIFRKS